SWQAVPSSRVCLGRMTRSRGAANAMVDSPLDPGQCNKAIKILEQFDRLVRKLGVRISARRLARLKALRDSGQITSSDLPATLAREFPGEFAGMTLAAIRNVCGKEN